MQYYVPGILNAIIRPVVNFSGDYIDIKLSCDTDLKYSGSPKCKELLFTYAI